MSIERLNEDVEPEVSPTFDSVFEAIKGFLYEKFPEKKLRNRLINIGLKEFLDHKHHLVEEHGFPFKVNSLLDEAILSLAHFLSRFRDDDNSELNVYALDRLSKGSDKNLAFWQSSKAKLYLELQSLILLLNGVGSRKSTVKRAFIFEKVDDLAFLTQSAVSVLSEQLAMGIEIGFLFLENPGHNIPLSNTLLIDFNPDEERKSEHKFNFYELHGWVADDSWYDLPYQERCTSKWYENSKFAGQDVNRLLEFLAPTWEEPISKNATGICIFDNPGEYINDVTVMMCKAFDQARGKTKDEDFTRRINQTVITNDLFRLERAIDTFEQDETKVIKAVDATSVKNSLKIHLYEPAYRHWIRSSLKHVLASDDKKLMRIYILKDEGRTADDEFQTLVREMQYYLDYFHYHISEMTRISLAHRNDQSTGNQANYQNNSSLEEKWNCFKGRIRAHITTSDVLRRFAGHIDHASHRKILRQILPSPRPKQVHRMLSQLDFLYTEGEEAMIYNFVTQRADPGELRFQAYLYRNSYDTDTEREILFEFMSGDLQSLNDLLLKYRRKALAESIKDYMTGYGRIIKGEKEERERYKELKGEIQNIMKILRSEKDLQEDDQETLLEIRQFFEQTLHEHFKEVYDYLYRLLEYQSVEVNFFEKYELKSIQEIEPFGRLTKKTARGLSDYISEQVETKITGGDPWPEVPKEKTDPRIPVANKLKGKS